VDLGGMYFDKRTLAIVIDVGNLETKDLAPGPEAFGDSGTYKGALDLDVSFKNGVRMWGAMGGMGIGGGMEGWLGTAVEISAKASGGTSDDFQESHAEVDVYAGFGGKFKFQIGPDADGRVGIDLGIGAALGIGVGVDVGFTTKMPDLIGGVEGFRNTAAGFTGASGVDPSAIADGLRENAEGVGEWVEGTAADVIDTARDMVAEGSYQASETTEHAEDTAEDVVDEVVDTVEDTAEKAEDTAEKVWDSMPW
jgi:hypothetical protein